MTKLTTAKRNALPDSAFALPRERKYPIDTRERAINAEGKSKRFATPKQRKQILRRIHERYPDLPKGTSSMERSK